MKVLNIGSLNIDRVYGVNHFVKPGETIKTRTYAEACGGKGLNQSIALARSGAEVHHVGAVGADGGMLLDVLKASGVHTEGTKSLSGASGHAVIQVDQNGQNNIIICGGANDSVSKEMIDEAVKEVEEGDIVLLQNEISNVGYAAETAKKAGAKVALNPSPINENLKTIPMNLVDYFILNEIEGMSDLLVQLRIAKVKRIHSHGNTSTCHGWCSRPAYSPASARPRPGPAPADRW